MSIPSSWTPPLFSGRTLYLLPDGLATPCAYAVLTQVLWPTPRKWALGRVVLFGGHRVLALVRPSGQLLALHVLHFPEQLRSAAALPPLAATAAASRRNNNWRVLLIDAACQPIAWSEYQDDSAEKLQLVNRRPSLEGRAPGSTRCRKKSPSSPWWTRLKRSVAQALHSGGYQQKRSGLPQVGKTLLVKTAAAAFKPGKKPSTRKSPRRRSA